MSEGLSKWIIGVVGSYGGPDATRASESRFVNWSMAQTRLVSCNKNRAAGDRWEAYLLGGDEKEIGRGLRLDEIVILSGASASRVTAAMAAMWFTEGGRHLAPDQKSIDEHGADE